MSRSIMLLVASLLSDAPAAAEKDGGRHEQDDLRRTDQAGLSGLCRHHHVAERLQVWCLLRARRTATFCSMMSLAQGATTLIDLPSSFLRLNPASCKFAGHLVAFDDEATAEHVRHVGESHLVAAAHRNCLHNLPGHSPKRR